MLATMSVEPEDFAPINEETVPLPALNGVGAFFDKGGKDDAEDAFTADVLADKPKGVGALLDIGGNDDDDVTAATDSPGDALDDDAPPKGVGAFVDMGGNEEDADADSFSSLQV